MTGRIVENHFLPSIKEVGQLRVMHIIEKGRVCDYQVNASVRQVSGRRISTGYIELGIPAELVVGLAVGESG